MLSVDTESMRAWTRSICTKFERTHLSNELAEELINLVKREIRREICNCYNCRTYTTKRGKRKAGFAYVQDLSGQIVLRSSR